MIFVKSSDKKTNKVMMSKYMCSGSHRLRFKTSHELVARKENETGSFFARLLNVVLTSVRLVISSSFTTFLQTFSTLVFPFEQTIASIFIWRFFSAHKRSRIAKKSSTPTSTLTITRRILTANSGRTINCNCVLLVAR